MYFAVITPLISVRRVRSSFLFLILSFLSTHVVAQTSTLSGISSVPVVDLPKEADYKTWTSSIYFLSSIDRPALNKGGASVFNYAYIALNYNFDRQQKISFRPTYNYLTGGLSNKGDEVREAIKTGDFHFTYGNSEIWRGSDVTKISGTVYLDLPTSESSRNKTMITQLRCWVILATELRPGLKLNYNFKPKLTFLREKSQSFEKSVSAARVSSKSTSSSGVVTTYGQWAQLEHTLELTYDINRTFSPFIESGLTHDVSYTENSSVSAIQDSVKLVAGSWLNINKTIKFRGFIQNLVPQKRNDSIGYFRDNGETQYILMTFITLL
jgi:hypothetical protein